MIALLVPMVLTAASVAAQPETSDALVQSLKRDIEALRDALGRVQSDLQEIKTLLQRLGGAGRAEEPRPQDIVLGAGDGRGKGDESARVVLVDFTDYQCPFCARYVRETLPALDTEYIKTGKLRYVLRDFPLEALHPQAFKAAEAAHCAGDQGKYWDMHDRLFANQGQLAPGDLAAHARAVALDGGAFDTCLRDARHAARVRKDMADGERAGVRGTPTFFLAIREGTDARLRVVLVIRGAQPLASFKEAIEWALRSEAR